eukprot:TRINITY_DN3432_c0_g2_i1.p2 TRINITY_DN3432_c0_g2~~TRINITY_DN3432_c0_g2_i1.p2  ORF type:complete len:189 (-),score=52.80 TRINITY_DN3432_c0_g2_i1:72-638(-)
MDTSGENSNEQEVLSSSQSQEMIVNFLIRMASNPSNQNAENTAPQTVSEEEFILPLKALYLLKDILKFSKMKIKYTFFEKYLSIGNENSPIVLSLFKILTVITENQGNAFIFENFPKIVPSLSNFFNFTSKDFLTYFFIFLKRMCTVLGQSVDLLSRIRKYNTKTYEGNTKLPKRKTKINNEHGRLPK